MKSWLFCLLLGAPVLASAQHEHHMAAPRDTTPQPHMHHGGDTSAMAMNSVFSKNLPMQVNASGTAWHPLNSPMYMHMWHWGKWQCMVHYGVFLRYSDQNLNRTPDQRGDAGFHAPNWFMAMAGRPVGRNGLLTVRRMFSLDPLTVGGAGYPLLFQTGESWNDRPLIDRQHPHDLISELAVAYTQAIRPDLDVSLYLAWPGEPALGPPAFMHRPSALALPSAPLGHHWQDATHISFGVATLGLRYGRVKLEGSLFNGREPGEKRYNLEKLRLNSQSVRLSVLPGRATALQASYGWLNGPERLHPEQDIERFSASVLHNIEFGEMQMLSTALVWGMNRHHTPGIPVSSGQALLAEGSWQSRRYTYSLRLEWTEKDAGELGLGAPGEGHVHDHQAGVGSCTLGASRFVWKNRYAWLDLGLSGTVYAVPEVLQPLYGRTPVSAEIFLRIIPPRFTGMK